jgi:hypothetical protein
VSRVEGSPASTVRRSIPGRVGNSPAVLVEGTCATVVAAYLMTGSTAVTLIVAVAVVAVASLAVCARG